MHRLIGKLWLAIVLAMPSLAHAEWKEAETAHFIIYSNSSDKEIEKLAARLESYDALMRMASNVSDKTEPVKVRIYEVASTADVEAALGLTASGVAGFYDSNILGPYAVTPRKTAFHNATFTPELVLHHEYAHHFMLQYFPSVYPSWYVEGFAELVGSSKMLPDGRIGYGMPAKHRGNEIAAYWVPLDEVLLTPPHKLRGFDLYAQGWAMTHFLTFSKERAPQLREYLKRLRGGNSPEEAAKAFGDLKALDREARRYVTRGIFEYRPVPVKIAQPAVQRLRALSPAEASLIPEVISLRDDELALYRKEGWREREQKLRNATLERIREKARRFAGDPFALHLLATAEYNAGNYAEAGAAADRLLALRPGHVRGMVMKSLSLARSAPAFKGQARAAQAAEARRLALAANAADKDDPLPLLAFFESYRLAGERAPRPALDSLASFVATLPADTRARQLLVDELAAQKRWAEAINQLLPIANSPHDSPRRQAAQEQLAKLRSELAKERGEAPETASS